EFGGSDNQWTGMWKVQKDYRSPIQKRGQVVIEKGKWHRIEYSYEADAKRVRVRIDGKEVLNFVDRHAAGFGKVYVGSANKVQIRNLVIRGHLDTAHYRQREARELFEREF